MYYKKTIKKYAVKARRAVQNRYIKKKSGYMPKVNTIARDVMRLKQLVNVEKKRVDLTVSSFTVAQINGGAAIPGYYVVDAMPSISQGITSSTRTGNSVKLQSMIVQMKLIQQTNTIVPIRLKVIFYRQIGSRLSTSASVPNCWEVNPFSGVLDYFSNRNPDTFQDIKILRTAYITVQPDNFSGQIQTYSRQFLFKLNHHYRFDNAGAPQEGLIHMLLVADEGDKGVALSGIQGQFTSRIYYTDN